jgi:hypothetical protein
MSDAIDFAVDEPAPPARDRASRALVVGLCAAVGLILLGAALTTAGLSARNKARSDLEVERALLVTQRGDVTAAELEEGTTLEIAGNYLAGAAEIPATTNELGRIGAEMVANSQAKRDNGLSNLPAYNQLGTESNGLIAQYNATIDQLNSQNATLRAILAGQAP